jgi:hypothetical protein
MLLLRERNISLPLLNILSLCTLWVSLLFALPEREVVTSNENHF